MQEQEGVHAVVFVHGYQGAASDLCVVRGHLLLLQPALECFSSRVNEVSTRAHGRHHLNCTPTPPQQRVYNTVVAGESTHEN